MGIRVDKKGALKLLAQGAIVLLVVVGLTAIFLDPAPRPCKGTRACLARLEQICNEVNAGSLRRDTFEVTPGGCSGECRGGAAVVVVCPGR
ncbi:MAG: hypothetical protein LAO51_08695 [Acidobacteriia bacterium]|nr:hypothetical protein [Terriglobia bacterium]